jgi:hypothetical protein
MIAKAERRGLHHEDVPDQELTDCPAFACTRLQEAIKSLTRGMFLAFAHHFPRSHGEHLVRFYNTTRSVSNLSLLSLFF